MSTAIATTTPEPRLSLARSLAARFQMEPTVFMETVKKTVFPNGTATNEQLAAFMAVAHEYKLNPFTREIYAFPTKGGGIQPIVSIDGWLHLVNSHPELDGIEFSDTLNESGKLLAVTCRIYRKDRTRPVEMTEYMSECARETEPWKKWPARMLRHKALIQAARYAFSFSGILDPDEAERIMQEQTPQIVAAHTHRKAEELAAKYAKPVEPEPQVAENPDAEPVHGMPLDFGGAA